MIDMRGFRNGRLTVESSAGFSRSGEAMWLCICDCGNEFITSGSRLRIGKTMSCGCLRADTLRVMRTSHGNSSSRLYKVWRGMKTRCYNKNHRAYQNYGGRGITVCSEWVDNFDAFQKWAMENGFNSNLPTKECTIDRIDNDKGYSPYNCRFVDMRVQRNNQRKVVHND
jgi:hypothetical protein